MKKIVTLAFTGLLTVFAVACSSSDVATSNGNTATTVATTTTTNTNSAAPLKSGTSEDVPANVRAVFPEAQSITKQHKDLTPEQIALIEKETKTKVTDTDHHSYLAFSTNGGARKQIGAATVIEADGKQMIVVYESRNGLPTIKEVRADGVAQTFLDQFKGKGHDDKFQIGQDLKAQGVGQATATAVSDAVRRDSVTMQTLYGSAHAH